VKPNPELKFEPINLDLHSDTCVKFRADSFVCSFGSDARFYEEGGKRGEHYLTRIAERMIHLPGSCVHVWQGPIIVGQIELNRYNADPTMGYVNLYYLAPSYRDRGWGRFLDEYAVSYLKSIGFSTARLSVSPTNLQAMRFYAKQGWTDFGPRPGFPEVHLMGRDF
jgi:GNAT superfamily N-acetyltransferase